MGSYVLESSIFTMKIEITLCIHIRVTTVLSAKSEVTPCFVYNCYQGLRIDISLVLILSAG